MRKPEQTTKQTEANELWQNIKKAFGITGMFDAGHKELFEAFRSVEKNGKSAEEVVALCREKIQKNSQPAAVIELDQTAQKLLDLGCEIWRGGDKARIYINNDFLEAVFGLVVGKTSFLNGEKISNNQAWKYTANKIFYCLNTNQIVGTSLKTIL